MFIPSTKFLEKLKDYFIESIIGIYILWDIKLHGAKRILVFDTCRGRSFLVWWEAVFVFFIACFGIAILESKRVRRPLDDRKLLRLLWITLVPW